MSNGRHKISLTPSSVLFSLFYAEPKQLKNIIICAWSHIFKFYENLNSNLINFRIHIFISTIPELGKSAKL